MLVDTFSRTHPETDIMDQFCSYVRVLHAVVRGASLKEQAEEVLEEVLGPAGKSMIKAFDRQLEKYL